MARKAKIPIVLPKGVEVKISDLQITVKGPKGTLQQDFKRGINIKVEGDKVHIDLDETTPDRGKFQGLYHSLVLNMVHGVSEGFEKHLQMLGVGYRAAVQGELLDVQVGLSHPCKLPIPEGISVTVEKNTNLVVSGYDKQKVGQFAAEVRALRPPEPYQGKGIRYKGEYVRKKAGKTSK